ncbi:MAG: hypothetical protein SP1CHLAM54_12490 [Chlamydiia bacterium]|nr:hypothetical protein [Chlamydiia bacterium]MCH9616147.1 hypothetical protein [Chlamydiia bacterium]MCH9629867.1 hypothetical protein [Chlamydiia bacterium]
MAAMTPTTAAAYVLTDLRFEEGRARAADHMVAALGARVPSPEHTNTLEALRSRILQHTLRVEVETPTPNATFRNVDGIKLRVSIDLATRQLSAIIISG